MNTDFEKIRQVFLAIVEEPSAQWDTLLDRACPNDTELRQQVAQLLRAHAGEEGILDRKEAGGALTAAFESLSERTGTVIGPYKLLQQIGEGGMGAVFMAEQTEPIRRQVALKVIKPGMDSRQIIARFDAERQALALMDHVNIARVFDGGTTQNGRPYFVMELVHGVPITNYCDDNHLTPRERLELFVPVCKAIQHAHQKGIIHRDVKPSNVMVTLYDGKPVPKVIDFGVAKATEQKLTERTLFTQYGTMVGTFEYMSPEQAEMSALGVDTRSDIYSLGVLLYELLTGSTPLTHKRMKEATYAEILRMIKEEEPPRPSTRLSDSGETLTMISAQRHMEPARLTNLVRGELDWIVMKCLEKERSRRYETASGIAADVQRYLNDEPVQACPPSAGYRFGKFARRNKRALATATGLALAALLVVGVVAGSLGWMARDRSVRQAKLNLEIEHGLDDATRALDQALTLIDNPYRWEAVLAEASSDLKRAEGLVAQDETAVEPNNRERLRALQSRLKADEADRRFAARFEEIRLEQSELPSPSVDQFKLAVTFADLKDAFQRYYHIEFGSTPAAEAAIIIRQRPKAMQHILLAGLEVSLDGTVRNDQQARQWLTALLDVADTGPWRKRAQQACQSSEWAALEQVVEEAVTARQPPSLLLVLAGKAPWDSPIRLKAFRRIRQAYPGDFWANQRLAEFLDQSPALHLDEAIRYYSAALALRPRNPVTCIQLGEALMRRGDLDGAIGVYREALDGHPDRPDAHRALAFALSRKGDLDGAIAELRQAVHSKDYAWDCFFLGQWLERKGLLDEAIAAYQQFIQSDPKRASRENLPRAHRGLGNTLCARGKPDEGAASYRRAIEIAPKEAALYGELGKALLQAQGKPADDPAAAYGKALQLYPKAAAAHSGLGVVLGTKRDWIAAIAAHRVAIALDPKDPMVHHYLGDTLQARGDINAAIDAYTEALKLDPNNNRAWCMRGQVHWKAGHLEKALADFSEAIEMFPDYLSLFGRAQVHAALRQWDRAIADYSNALESHPQKAEVLAARGRAYQMQGRWDEAAADFEQAIPLAAPRAPLQNELAWLLATCPKLKIRNARRAVELSREAVAQMPQAGGYWTTLGVAHYRAGDWKVAVAELTRSIELHGENACNCFFQAMAHWQSGEKEEARKWHGRAVAWMEKNKPHDEELRRFQAEATELLQVEQKKE
jgi:serine/threonine protein kinase/Tfp pilus assembly protein PilF